MVNNPFKNKNFKYKINDPFGVGSRLLPQKPNLPSSSSPVGSAGLNSLTKDSGGVSVNTADGLGIKVGSSNRGGGNSSDVYGLTRAVKKQDEVIGIGEVRNLSGLSSGAVTEEERQAGLDQRLSNRQDILDQKNQKIEADINARLKTIEEKSVKVKKFVLEGDEKPKAPIVLEPTTANLPVGVIGVGQQSEVIVSRSDELPFAKSKVEPKKTVISLSDIVPFLSLAKPRETSNFVDYFYEQGKNYNLVFRLNNNAGGDLELYKGIEENLYNVSKDSRQENRFQVFFTDRPNPKAIVSPYYIATVIAQKNNRSTIKSEDGTNIDNGTYFVVSGVSFNQIYKPPDVVYLWIVDTKGKVGRISAPVPVTIKIHIYLKMDKDGTISYELKPTKTEPQFGTSSVAGAISTTVSDQTEGKKSITTVTKISKVAPTVATFQGESKSSGQTEVAVAAIGIGGIAGIEIGATTGVGIGAIAATNDSMKGVLGVGQNANLFTVGATQKPLFGLGVNQILQNMRDLSKQNATSTSVTTLAQNVAIPDTPTIDPSTPYSLTQEQPQDISQVTPANLGTPQSVIFGNQPLPQSFNPNQNTQISNFAGLGATFGTAALGSYNFNPQFKPSATNAQDYSYFVNPNSPNSTQNYPNTANGNFGNNLNNSSNTPLPSTNTQSLGDQSYYVGGGLGGGDSNQPIQTQPFDESSPNSYSAVNGENVVNAGTLDVGGGFGGNFPPRNIRPIGSGGGGENEDIPDENISDDQVGDDGIDEDIDPSALGGDPNSDSLSPSLPNVIKDLQLPRSLLNRSYNSSPKPNNTTSSNDLSESQNQSGSQSDGGQSSSQSPVDSAKNFAKNAATNITKNAAINAARVAISGVVSAVAPILVPIIAMIVGATMIFMVIFIAIPQWAECHAYHDNLAKKIRDELVEPVAWASQGGNNIIDTAIKTTVGFIPLSTIGSLGLLPPSNYRKWVESLPDCSDLSKLNCGDSSRSSSGKGVTTVCLEKELATRQDNESINLWNASNRSVPTKISIIKEVIQAGKSANVSSETIAFVLSIAPTESSGGGSPWRANNGLGYLGIGQVGVNERSAWALKATGGAYLGDAYFLDHPEYQMRIMEVGLKEKIAYKCAGSDKSDIYNGAYGWLTCDGEDANGTKSSGYAEAAEKNFNIITCAKQDAPTDSSIKKVADKYWSEVFGFRVKAHYGTKLSNPQLTTYPKWDKMILAFNYEMRGKLSVEAVSNESEPNSVPMYDLAGNVIKGVFGMGVTANARFGKATGITDIPPDLITKLEELEKNDKISIWELPADIAMPSVEAKQKRLNINVVRLIIVLAQKYEHIRITGMNDGSSHADYAGGHFTGLSVDVDLIRKDGKTYEHQDAVNGNTAGRDLFVDMAETAYGSGYIRGLISAGLIHSTLVDKGWTNDYPNPDLTKAGKTAQRDDNNHSSHFHFYVRQDGEGVDVNGLSSGSGGTNRSCGCIGSGSSVVAGSGKVDPNAVGTSSQSEQFTPEVRAMLDTIALEENPNSLDRSAYFRASNKEEGEKTFSEAEALAGFPEVFKSTSDGDNPKYGRYNFYKSDYDEAKRNDTINGKTITNFMPENQDKIALYKLRVRRVLGALVKNDLKGAFNAASYEWSTIVKDGQTSPTGRTMQKQLDYYKIRLDYYTALPKATSNPNTGETTTPDDTPKKTTLLDSVWNSLMGNINVNAQGIESVKTYEDKRKNLDNVPALRKKLADLYDKKIIGQVGITSGTSEINGAGVVYSDKDGYTSGFEPNLILALNKLYESGIVWVGGPQNNGRGGKGDHAEGRGYDFWGFGYAKDFSEGNGMKGYDGPIKMFDSEDNLQIPIPKSSGNESDPRIYRLNDITAGDGGVTPKVLELYGKVEEILVSTKALRLVITHDKQLAAYKGPGKEKLFAGHTDSNVVKYALSSAGTNGHHNHLHIGMLRFEEAPFFDDKTIVPIGGASGSAGGGTDCCPAPTPVAPDSEIKKGTITDVKSKPETVATKPDDKNKSKEATPTEDAKSTTWNNILVPIFGGITAKAQDDSIDVDSFDDSDISNIDVTDDTTAGSPFGEIQPETSAEKSTENPTQNVATSLDDADSLSDSTTPSKTKDVTTKPDKTSPITASKSGKATPSSATPKSTTTQSSSCECPVKAPAVPTPMPGPAPKPSDPKLVLMFDWQRFIGSSFGSVNVNAQADDKKPETAGTPKVISNKTPKNLSSATKSETPALGVCIDKNGKIISSAQDKAVLAKSIVAMMKNNGYKVNGDGKGMDIVYIRGMDTDGKANAYLPNTFSDARIIIEYDQNQNPTIAGIWDSTIRSTRKYYSKGGGSGADGKGAFMIGNGQWGFRLGIHHYSNDDTEGEGLRIYHRKNHEPDDITGDFTPFEDEIVRGVRDVDRNGLLNSPPDTEEVQFAGIDQHHGYDQPKDNAEYASAGCLSGMTRKGHTEFMSKIKEHYTQGEEGGERITTTIMENTGIVGQ